MTDEPFDLMGYVEEETQSGGGGGLITEVQVDGVWLVFEKGKRSEEWVFNNQEDGIEAKQKALDYIDENNVKDSKGKTARPYVGFRITQYDDVLNRDEPMNWSDGKIAKSYPGFSSAYQQIIKPSLEEYVGPDKQFAYGERFWAHVGFEPDPDKPTYISAGLEEKPNLVPYITYAYANKKEALEAAESGDMFAFIDIPSKPEQYTIDDNWDSFARDIVRYFADDPDAPADIWIEESQGVTEELVLQLREEALAMQDENLPF